MFMNGSKMDGTVSRGRVQGIFKVAVDPGQIEEWVVNVP
jgi:hypothetical protein